MSLVQFRKRIRTCSMHEPDRQWFPKWLANYAGFHGRQDDDMLPVETEALVAFLRQLLERHVYAWQRLQAARAVELYRDLVIRSEEPSYVEILAKLAQITARA